MNMKRNNKPMQMSNGLGTEAKQMAANPHHEAANIQMLIQQVAANIRMMLAANIQMLS
jgi:hypothetical protein